MRICMYNVFLFVTYARINQNKLFQYFKKLICLFKKIIYIIEYCNPVYIQHSLPICVCYNLQVIILYIKLN